MSFQKYNICSLQNVEENFAREISNLFGIPITKDLGRYLGNPSFHGRMKLELYQQAIDKIGAKLEGWKTKQLSFVGRTVLAQLVLASIPQY